FLLHAIRYALITLDQKGSVIQALHDENVDIQMTALVVLDQMEPSPLTREHLRPFLMSEEADLRETGIWVLGHHPEWADIVTEHLATEIANTNLSEKAIAEMESLLIAFCGQPEIRSFVRRTLDAPSSGEEVRLAMMRVMSQCSGPVPEE